MPSSKKSIFPYIALTIGVLSLSVSALFIRWAQAPGPVTSFYRMAIAALILAPFILLHLRRVGLPGARWLIIPVLGGLFTALDHFTWSTALASTRIANATLLNNIAPLWVALFAALVWRERLSARFWLGLTITLGGMGLVMSTDMVLAPGMNGGNLLAVLSSLFYAGYYLITQRGRSRVDALTYVWIVDLFAALSLLGFTRVFNMPLFGFTGSTWLVFFFAALVSQIGGYFSIAYALGHLPASVVSPTMVFQPVLSALIAIPFTGEMLAPLQWVGGLAVLAGIFLVNMRQAEAQPV